MQKFSEWLLNEVRMSGHGVVQQKDFPASQEAEEREFMGLQQKPRDLIYFGIHLMGKHFKQAPPEETVEFHLDKIRPYCGAVIHADRGNHKIYTTMPAKRGGIKKLDTKLIKRGNLKDEEVLVVDTENLFDISRALVPPSLGQKLWLYAANPYQRELARRIRIQTGATPSLPTAADVEATRKWFRSLPGGTPAKQIPNLNTLLGDEPEIQPTQSPMAQMFVPRNAIQQKLQRMKTPNQIYAPTPAPALALDVAHVSFYTLLQIMNENNH
jgi:hypothetical protein